jgi:hypothetical protein
MTNDKRGVAQFGLARLAWDQEVGGSNPPAPNLKQRFKPREERSESRGFERPQELTVC